MSSIALRTSIDKFDLADLMLACAQLSPMEWPQALRKKLERLGISPRWAAEASDEELREALYRALFGGWSPSDESDDA